MYYYFYRSNSIVHQETYKAAIDKFEMRIMFYEGIKEKGYSKEILDSCFANAALSYAMRIKYNPNDYISLKANEILKSYKRIPSNLLWQQKIMMFMYINDIPLFDVCCELMGKRIHETMAII